MFYQGLPTNIQQHLFTVRKQLSIDKLAELADEFQAETPGVSTVESCGETGFGYTQSFSKVIEQLTGQIDALQTKLSRVENSMNCSGHRSRVNNYHYNRRRSNSRARSKFCFYHERFGMSARKCVSSCSSVKKNLKRQTVIREHIHISRLLYITDSLTQHRFLIDTGADVSILPAKNFHKTATHVLLPCCKFITHTSL